MEGGLLDQVAELILEAAENPRLGHADGGRADPQAGGNVGRRLTLDGGEPERLPGPLFDLFAASGLNIKIFVRSRSRRDGL